MEDKIIKTIYWQDETVMMLDQSRLPLEVKYVPCKNYLTIAEGIKKMCIRGAPAIGIAAAMAMALGAKGINANSYNDFINQLSIVSDCLLKTRPTAVNIRWAIDRMYKLLDEHKNKSVQQLKRLLFEESQAILQEDIEINKKIGAVGAEFIKDGDSILTHCNAGSLATGGYGTATAAIYTAFMQGKKIKVFADETRPVLQGARLTAWELMQAGIDVTLITDNTAGALMKNGLINVAIVGTDRTTSNGDVANKIGTYSVAVLCKEHGIPFYVAAPISSIDFNMPSGDLIPIEERSPDEVTTIWGNKIAPDGVKALNLAFDVTPAKYVTGFFTEKGFFKPYELLKAKADN